MNSDSRVKRGREEPPPAPPVAAANPHQHAAANDAAPTDPTAGFVQGFDGEDLIFADDAAFPSLPNFPFLSSPSRNLSSSSSSSSSTSSWNFLDLLNGVDDDDMQQHVAPPPPSDGAEILADVDLMDPFDPALLFPEESVTIEDDGQKGTPSSDPGTGSEDPLAGEVPSEDLAKVFLDWLKSNKDSISPEDLRSIKLKKSTIDCAARRLGGGETGRMQLLKLILAWVQNHHLQRKRRRNRNRNNGGNANPPITYQYQQQQQSYQPIHQLPAVSDSISGNQNPNLDYAGNAWVQHPSMMLGYGSRGSANHVVPLQPASQYQYPTNGIMMNGQSFSPSPEFEAGALWQAAQFQMNPNPYSPYPNPPTPHATGPSQFPGNYTDQVPGQPMFNQSQPPVMGMTSATKEARKKRMARQRRLRFTSFNHHRNHGRHHQQQQQPQQNTGNHGLPTESSSSSMPNNSSWPNSRNWAPFWQSLSSSSTQQTNSISGSHLQQPSKLPAVPQPLSAPIVSRQQMNSQPNASSLEKRQGWRSEKNLRFLLQKVLKQSDVGSLGRIVLPKKEAEIHLPKLGSRDGISIQMVDIATSQVWNMRYRYWPNNKSRMYLLENTGDFVRSNGLKEGDFIVIYLGVKCGKYMIRGVKVRQPLESKGFGAGTRARQH